MSIALSAEPAAVITVRDLKVVVSGPAKMPIVDGVSLTVPRGKVLGIVGESGSGKTTLSLALLGYARPGSEIVGGTVTVAGHEMVDRPETLLRQIRGRVISFVPQDPSVALNPAMRVGSIVSAMAGGTPDEDRLVSVRSALETVSLPTSTDFLRRYPHQLSGGQQQRVAVAAALVGRPDVVVFDEPTTGLDVVTQSKLLAQVRLLSVELGTTVVWVSHNLAVIGEIADDVAVMYAGQVVEHGSVDQVLRAPRHPYTRALIRCVPDIANPLTLVGIPGTAVGPTSEPLPGCVFGPRCSQHVAHCDTARPPLVPTAPGDAHLVSCFESARTPPIGIDLAGRKPAPEVVTTGSLLDVRDLVARHVTSGVRVSAAEGVSFLVRPGEALALVGESGSGKTTIARCVAGLHSPDAGSVIFEGRELAASSSSRSRADLQGIQMVFQNPYDSLNPKKTILEQVSWPARRLQGLGKHAAQSLARELLSQVRLPAPVAERYPHELSGGERQRVAIARALAARPRLLICDEITSALDVSVQASVLQLLADIRSEFDLALLFITHDLGVVSNMCERIVVLESGHICETGDTRDVLDHPVATYTRNLISAAPRLAGHPVDPAHAAEQTEPDVTTIDQLNRIGR